MSNPTTPFGWQMPTATDLVTDLPADFEVFGQAVATSMGDLLGGTTGQILSKATNTDMDFTWVSPNPGDITGITATSPLTGGGTSGDVTVGIQASSTTQSGAVQLTDSTSSTSTTTAATPNSVKTSYDLASAAIAKSTVTTAGDIIYRNATVPTRLGIGTANQVLRVNSGATAPEWATVSSGAMTFINRTTFSAVSSQIFDSVFSSTYDTYLVVVERILGTTGSDDLQMQLRYGSTTQAASYYGSTTTFTSSTVYQQSSNAAQFTMASLISKAGQYGSAAFYVNNVGNASEPATIYGNGMEGETPGGAYIFGCLQLTAQTYTGFLLKPSAGTMTGEVSIYGLAKA